MKQTKIFAMVLMAAALLTTSCASKKDLQNCQTENRELTANYQDTKEKLAATEASLAFSTHHSMQRWLPLGW